MAAPLEYNKIAIQEYRRKLASRRASLPTLKNKESVLRLTVQKLREETVAENRKLDALVAKAKENVEFWAEFPYNIFALSSIVTKSAKIAGVAVPEFDRVEWKEREYSRFNKPGWLSTGVGMLREIAVAAARTEILRRQIAVLEKARLKTTQKVNLYEKVQIPEYQEAIGSIKRYLEDVENLEKAAMKIVKQRLNAERALP